MGGVHDWNTFRQYVLGGVGGPGGRPLALLSFLINDTGWPSDPWSFKYTNVLFHLLNGVLLFALSHRLLRDFLGQKPREAAWAALLASALWLLHPLLVSTTLYVVQRMAILSATFVLLGLHGYLHGRSWLERRPVRAYLGMGASVVSGTALAVLCKENGALLPALILVLEFTLLSAASGTRPSWRFIGLFLGLPGLVILAYLVYVAVTGSGYQVRDFGPLERLLTQGRVLFDYLYHWFVPWLPARGLFNENYVVSTGWFSPATTLPAALGIAALLAGAVSLSRRWPLLSGGVLFFLVGHALESTTLGLEIYFEHRNYLPAMLLWLPLAAGLVRLVCARKAAAALPVALVALVAVNTAARAQIWGDEVRLALHWAGQNPTSQRAQRVAAYSLEQAGRPDLALATLALAMDHLPANIPIRLHWLVLKCSYDTVTPDDIQASLRVLETAPYDFRTFELLKTVLDVAPGSACRGLDGGFSHAMLAALARNPAAQSKLAAQRQLTHLRGYLFAAGGDGGRALQAFTANQALKPELDTGLSQVAILASRGFYREALLHLEAVRRNAPPPEKFRKRLASLDYAAEFERLERQLREDLARQENAQGTELK